MSRRGRGEEGGGRGTENGGTRAKRAKDREEGEEGEEAEGGGKRNDPTDLLRPPAEALDHLALHLQWKWRLGPGVRAHYNRPCCAAHCRLAFSFLVGSCGWLAKGGGVWMERER